MEIIDANTCFGFYPYRDVASSVENLLSNMEIWKISRALAVSMKGIFYDYIEGNAETLAVCKNNKSLIPVATIDPRKTCDFEGEIQKCMESGFKVMRLFPEYQAWNTAEVPFRKLLKVINRHQIPLIINESPSKLYDFTEETTVPIVFLNSHYYRLYETLAVFEDRSNFYAEARHLISPDAVEVFVERIGADRLVFGSNNPLEYTGSAICRINEAEISEQDKASIFGSNIKRIMQLD